MNILICWKWICVFLVAELKIIKWEDFHDDLWSNFCQMWKIHTTRYSVICQESAASVHQQYQGIRNISSISSITTSAHQRISSINALAASAHQQHPCISSIRASTKFLNPSSLISPPFILKSPPKPCIAPPWHNSGQYWPEEIQVSTDNCYSISLLIRKIDVDECSTIHLQHDPSSMTPNW